LVGGGGSQGEQSPPQAVAQSFRITVDQTRIGQCLQGRDTWLFSRPTSLAISTTPTLSRRVTASEPKVTKIAIARCSVLARSSAMGRKSEPPAPISQPLLLHKQRPAGPERDASASAARRPTHSVPRCYMRTEGCEGAVDCAKSGCAAEFLRRGAAR